MVSENTDLEAGKPFDCLIIGEGSLVRQCGDLLLEAGHRIRGILTLDASLASWSDGHDLAYWKNRDAMLEALRGARPEYLFSIGNMTILPRRVVELPVKAAVNYHDGPLPKYAGVHTPSWAIMNGEPQHGVTWHMMEGKVDAGRILKQAIFGINPTDTAYSLNLKCYEAAIMLFKELIGELASGSLEPQAQDLSQRSYFGMYQRPTRACSISWNRSALEIDGLVRALEFGSVANPLGRAKASIGDEVFLCPELEIFEAPSDREPGTVIEAGPSLIRVATSTNDVVIRKLLSLDGAPLSLEEVCSRCGVRAGSLLQDQDESFDRRSTEAYNELCRRESFWVERLKSLRAPQVPYFKAPLGAESQSRIVSRRAKVPDSMIDAVQRNLPDERFCDVLLAAFAIYISRICDEPEYDLGLEIGLAETDLIGLESLFSTVIPLRIDVEGASPFQEAYQAVAKQLLLAKENRGFSRDILARYPELSPTAEQGLAALLPVRVERVASLADFTPRSCVGLTLVLQRAGDEFLWSAHSETLPEPEAQQMLDQFMAFLRGLAESWQSPIAQARILSDGALQDQLEIWNATAMGPIEHTSIPDAFERQAASSPDAIALVYGRRELTYRELEGRANRWARYLRKLGVEAESLVGVMVSRSDEMLAVLLGILKAGGGYVPLDPAYPKDRIDFMLRDSGAKVLITEERLLGLLPDYGSEIVCLEGARNDIEQESEDRIETRVRPGDLAYVIYTSGSTGKPKGVMVEHRNVLNFFVGMDDRVEFDSDAALLAVTSLSFDISVLELFWTLTRGIRVVVYNAERAIPAADVAPAKADERSMDFSLFYFSADQSEDSSNKYRLLMEGAKFADRKGFQAVWTPERHFHDFGGLYPNPSVTSAALAAITENVQIRSGSIVAPLHSPIRIAEEWAVVDNLSKGRVGISFASGWMPEDFVIKPEAFADRKESMFRSIETVRRLWRGESVSFPSPLGENVEVSTLPRPIQSELPVWVTTAGNPETYEMAAKLGANILTHLLGQSVEEVAEKISRYREAWKKAGHPGRGHISLMLHTFVSDCPDFVKETVREPLTEYLRTSASLIKKYSWSFPTFKRLGKSVEDVSFGDLNEEEMDALLSHSFNRYFETSGLFGTPESCRAMIDKLKQHDVDEVACLVDFGISPDLVLENLKHLDALRATTCSTSAINEEDGSIPALIRRHGVTHFQCTPSMASMLLLNESDHAAFAALKTWMVGGEPFPAALAAQIQDLIDGDAINMYGPTETTIWSTTHRVDRLEGPVSIGRPIANTQIYIVDKNLQPVPIGMSGELMIGGLGVVRGYLNRPELTKERFIDNPFSSDPNSRLYRTGDLARYEADGSLQFIGRTDHQVKIRGHRIELGEIDAAIHRHPAVRECVTIAKDDAVGNKQLATYFIARDGSDAEPSEIREHLRGTLPDYMLPARFVKLERFPQTPNKKIDRKALAAISPQPKMATPSKNGAANSMLVAEIVNVAGEILGLEGLDPNDNFFDLGGDSLSAVRVVVELSKKFGAKVSIQTLLDAPILSELAKKIEAMGVGDEYRKSIAEPMLQKGTPGGASIGPPRLDSEEIRKATSDPVFMGGVKRLLQMAARVAPGAKSWRVKLHRWRGVNIGEGVWIGYDVIIETSYPKLVSIGNNVVINAGVMIIAHFLDSLSVVIEDDVFIGPNATILPNVRIGRGAVIASGSVVSTSVPPMTMVQGNPAAPVAETGMPLTEAKKLNDFVSQLKPLG